MKTLMQFFMIAASVLLIAKKSESQTNTFPSTGAAGIGTTSPDPSSLFEVVSTSKGILIPRMTKTQRDAIAIPSTGLLIYQTNSTPGFYYYNGTAWVAISTKGANTSLSNLAATTSINQNLLPNTSSTLDLGSSSVKWRDIYTGSVKFSDGTQQTTALQWIANGSNIYFNGAVGIGVSSPTYKLDILGDINLANGNVLRIGGTPALAVSSSTGSIAIGKSALVNNTTGYSNVAVGTAALNNNSGGHNLVAIGDSALFSQSIDASNFYSNTALGSKSLYSNTIGNGNTAAGTKSLFSNTIGQSNTAVGVYALFHNTTGTDNVANGEGALQDNITGSYNTANGYGALFVNKGSSNTAMGSAALYNNDAGYSNVAIGVEALSSEYNISNLVAVGDSALGRNGTGVLSGIDGTANVAVGSKALLGNTTGRANSGLGFQVLYTNTTGIHNTAFGYQALYTASGGNGNTCVGYQAGLTVTTGGTNTLIGSTADCSSGSLSNATAIGQGAIVDASNKVVIGNTSVTKIGGYAGWTTYPSDERFKKEIKDNVPGLAFIKKLKPVTYQVDVSAIEERLHSSQTNKSFDNKEFSEKNTTYDKHAQDEKSKIRYTGFVAQDVEKAAKSIGYDFSGIDVPKNDKDFYGLRYAEFVVPLVKAVQELSAQNDSLKHQNETQQQINNALQKQLDDIKNSIAQMQSAMSQCCNNFSSSITSSDNALSITKNSDQPRLEQNVPNPFDGSCYIGYYIPSGVHNAQLRITDVKGHILKTYSLTTPGYGKQTIYGSEFSSGMYQYSLLIDGKLVDTKKMERLKQ